MILLSLSHYVVEQTMPDNLSRRHKNHGPAVINLLCIEDVDRAETPLLWINHNEIQNNEI